MFCDDCGIFEDGRGLTARTAVSDSAAVKGDVDEEADEKEQKRSDDGAEDGVFPAEATVLDVACGSEDAICGEYDVELRLCWKEAESGCEEPEPEPVGGVGC